MRGSDYAALAPWATLLRSFELVTGGPNVFHHGCDLGGLLALLADPAGAADVAALLQASLPALTHLSLGSVGDDVEVLERLAVAQSFPKLQELCLASGPHRTSAGWDRIADAPFSVYLHGTLVTPEYPKRTG